MYKGYHIAAGTTVIPNIWAIHHDPDLYPEPHAFNPERYLTRKEDVRPESLIEGHYTFGFGRRYDLIIFMRRLDSFTFLECALVIISLRSRFGSL